MIGPCENSVVLDAGCGPSWLFDILAPKKAYSCDYIDSPRARKNSIFTTQSILHLDYESEQFDVVVASLVLMWIAEDDLLRACGELFRVVKSRGGRSIVALMHPYFYRTGTVIENCDFNLNQDLSQTCSKVVSIAERTSPITYHYRSYDIYLNTFIKAGWRVKYTRDWFIDMDEYESELSDRKKKISRTNKVPMYTFFELVRD